MTFHAVLLLRCLDDTSPEKNKTRILTDQKKEKVGPVKQTCGAETDVSLQGQQGHECPGTAGTSVSRDSRDVRDVRDIRDSRDVRDVRAPQLLLFQNQLQGGTLQKRLLVS